MPKFFRRMTSEQSPGKGRFVVAFLLRAIVAFGAFSFSVTLVNVSNYEVLGIVMTTISVLTILASFCRFGTDNGLLRFGSVYLAKKEFYKYRALKFATYKVVTLITTVLSLIATLLIMFNPSVGIASYDEYAFVIAALIFPPYTLLMTQSSILKVLGKPQLSPIYEVGFVLALSSIIFFLSGLFGIKFGVNAAIITISLSVLITILSGSLYINSLESKKLPTSKVNKNAKIPSEVKKCLPSFATISVLSFVFQWGTVSLVTLLSSTFESGVFAVLSRLAVVLGFGSLVVNTLIAPKIATLYEMGNMSEIARLVNKSVLFSLSFTLVAVAIMYIFHVEIFSLLELEVRDYGKVLLILVLSQTLNVTAGPLGLLLNMTGNQGAMKNALILSILSLITTCIFLVPGYGALGGSIAFLISMFLQNTYSALVSAKRLGIVPLSRKVLH